MCCCGGVQIVRVEGIAVGPGSFEGFVYLGDEAKVQQGPDRPCQVVGGKVVVEEVRPGFPPPGTVRNKVMERLFVVLAEPAPV